MLVVVASIVASRGLIPTAHPPHGTLDAFWAATGRQRSFPGANTSSLYRVFLSRWTDRINGDGGSTAEWAAEEEELVVYENRVDHRLSEASYIRPNRSVAFTSYDAPADAADAAFSVVTVVAAKEFRRCILRPSSLRIACDVINRTTAQFRIASGATAQLSVELDGETDYVRHVLLVFANPVEAGPPHPMDGGISNDTLYFGAGVHYLGGQIPIPAHVTNIYLAPGAYVHGGFITTGPGPVHISGRGVLSGEMFAFHSPNFTWSLVNMDKGAGHSIQGIILVDPPQYYFRSYAPDTVVRNVKMASAWPYNSDGVGVGLGGVVEDTFIRANDDSLKLFGEGMRVRNIVVWQMENGGVFQTGWWGAVDRRNISVDGVDIIHAEWGAFTGRGSDNDAIFDNCGTTTKTYATSGITISNVRIEGDVLRLFNILLSAGSTGLFARYTVTNVTLVDGIVWGTGRIAGAQSGARIDGLAIQNVVIGGVCRDTAQSLNVTVDGQTTGNVTLTCL